MGYMKLLFEFYAQSLMLEQEYHKEIRCKYPRYGQHTTKCTQSKEYMLRVYAIYKCMRFRYIKVLFTLINLLWISYIDFSFR